MPAYYIYKCTCGYERERYRNVKKCPRCKGDLKRMEELKGLVPGRIVHWVCKTHYPAMVIEATDKVTGYCVLRVFGQFPADDERVECAFDEKCSPNTWHWIERE